MGKLDRQNDSLFERLLGHLEPGDVIPADVGLVNEDRACETGAKLFHLRILVAILIVLPAFPRAPRSRSAQYTIKRGRGTHFFPSPPGPPFAIPFAPIARRARFSPICDRCSLSCSARPRYSPILALIRVFERSFFSSTRSIPVFY
jgi:hypothetical protein